MSECKHTTFCIKDTEYDNCMFGSGLIVCVDCEKRVFDIKQENADLRAKNKEFADITDEYVANGYKLADAVEKVEIENRDLKLERVELSKKVGRFESQVTVLRGIVEKASYQTITHHFVTKPTELALEAKKALSIAPTETSQKLQEHDKYAELGRLAIETIDSGFTEVCLSSNVMDLGCEDCGWLSFCRKRAELLAEVQK